MKKSFLLIGLLLLCFFTSCKSDYTGPKVSFIEKTTIDYMGGYSYKKKIDFINNEVLFTDSFLDGPYFFNPKYSFDEEKEYDCINALFEAGLFNIKTKYTTDHLVIDGGGWNLEIVFEDGSKIVSSGSNASPRDIFLNCDYAFFKLYGDDFFGLLSDSYKNPPSIDISFVYGNASYGYGLSASNYTWRGKEVNNIDNVSFAIKNQKYEFVEQEDYSFCLWTSNYEYKFSKMVIKSYDLNGFDETEVFNSKWFKSKQIDLVLDRIYVIYVYFNEGVCEYPFSTALIKIYDN